MEERKSQPNGSEVPKRKEQRNHRAKKNKQSQYIWATKVFFISLVTTAVLSIITGESMENMPLAVTFVLLILFVIINILFDVIGLAVATAAEGPFHSMAAKKNRVGRRAVRLLKNADRVSSVCNDIIGDIAGIISGATGVTIAAKMVIDQGNRFWITLIMTSVIAAITVGGKAFAKRIAIMNSVEIVILTARLICLFSFKEKNVNKDKKKNSG